MRYEPLPCSSNNLCSKSNACYACYASYTRYEPNAFSIINFVHRGMRVTHVFGVMNEIPFTQIIFGSIRGLPHITYLILYMVLRVKRVTLFLVNRVENQNEPKRPQSVGRLGSFWFSTRPFAETGTDYNLHMY